MHIHDVVNSVQIIYKAASRFYKLHELQLHRMTSFSLTLSLSVCVYVSFRIYWQMQEVKEPGLLN